MKYNMAKAVSTKAVSYKNKYTFYYAIYLEHLKMINIFFSFHLGSRNNFVSVYIVFK